MKLLIIISSVVILLILLILILNLPVCGGGEIISNPCGKILFPWTKKFKLPSGKYCCKACYLADLQTFAELYKENDAVDKKETAAQRELNDEIANDKHKTGK